MAVNHRPLLSKARALAVVLWGDFLALFAGPLRADWKRRLRGAAFAAALLAAMPFGDEVAGRTRVERGTSADKTLTFIEKMGMNRVVLGVSAAAFAAGKLTSCGALWQAGALAFETQIFTNLFNSTFKGVFGRRRPPDAEGPWDFEFLAIERGSKNSFPSAHAAHAFGLATAAAMRGGAWWGVPAYALASTVGAARVLHGQHFLSDVMAGAMLGVYVGRTLGRRHEERRAAWKKAGARTENDSSTTTRRFASRLPSE